MNLFTLRSRTYFLFGRDSPIFPHISLNFSFCSFHVRAASIGNNNSVQCIIVLKTINNRNALNWTELNWIRIEFVWCHQYRSVFRSTMQKYVQEHTLFLNIIYIIEKKQFDTSFFLVCAYVMRIYTHILVNIPQSAENIPLWTFVIRIYFDDVCIFTNILYMYTFEQQISYK